MTEPLSIKDLNCGTCPHKIKSTKRFGFMKCDLSNYLITSDTHIDSHMEFVGCASHPLALKTLITPIIIELETQKALAHKRMNNYLDMGHDGNWQGGKEEGFEEAIEILRSS